MEAREEEDKINDFGRDPIGEGQEERVRSFTSYCLPVTLHSLICGTSK